MKRIFLVLLVIFVFLGVVRSVAAEYRGLDTSDPDVFEVVKLKLVQVSDYFSELGLIFDFESEYKEMQYLRAYYKGFVGLFEPVVEHDQSLDRDVSYYITYVLEPDPWIPPPQNPDLAYNHIWIENLDGSLTGYYFSPKYVNDPFVAHDFNWSSISNFGQWIANLLNSVFQLFLSILRILLSFFVSCIEAGWNLLRIIFNITFTFD